MQIELGQLFDAHDGILTYAQIMSRTTPGTLRGLLRRNEIHRVWHGIYSFSPPDDAVRLKGLGLRTGHPVVGCLHTAASLMGFGTEASDALHVIDPNHRHVHPRPGLTVHQRLGAPTVEHNGLVLTELSWTAVEVARELSQPRALATLDAALGSTLCTVESLSAAVDAQSARPGVVAVRRLVALADGRAASPMESETRLVLVNDGIETPELQWPVHDEFGRVRHILDFAWPEHMLALEYDGNEFHSDPADVGRDKMRTGWLIEQGWRVLQIVVDDVRRMPDTLCRRVRQLLSATTLAV